MALTRAMLKGMSLTEEQIGAIIDEHTNVTASLKDQIKQYKADAERLPEVQKELEDAKKNAVSAGDWEKKFNDEHTAFEQYKTTIAEKEKSEKLKSAYRKLLLECKVGEKHIDSILRVTDFSDVKLKDDGSFEGVDDLKKKIGTEWSGFVVSTGTRSNGEPDTPPGGNDPEPKKTGRAAQLAAKYHETLYGKVKEG